MFEFSAVEIFLTPLIHLVLIFSFALILKAFFDFRFNKQIIVFCAIYSISFYLTALPVLVPEFGAIIDSKWNWEGKILTIIFGSLFYLLIKGKTVFFFPNSFKVNKKYLIAILLFYLITGLWSLLFINTTKFSLDTLSFQLVIPSISEELIFRGILLGLMINFIYKKETTFWIPSILISILFGFGHSLFYKAGLSIKFEGDLFINTTLYSLFWCWITFKSKSIFYSIFSHSLHNLSNGFE